MGDVFEIARAMVPVIIALIWAAWLVWHDLFDRRHPPYVALTQAAAVLDGGDARLALLRFRRAAVIAARYRDLAALGAAWEGIARARETLGDKAGAAAAANTASDAARQISSRPDLSS